MVSTHDFHDQKRMPMIFYEPKTKKCCDFLPSRTHPHILPFSHVSIRSTLTQPCFLIMDLEAIAETVENSSEKISASCEGNSIEEPNVGMEFESEETAKHFYDEYARREGFVVRLDRCHRSEVDNRIISRRFSCNKQGFHVRGRNGTKPVHKPRASIREGCEAMMLVKVNKCGKWVVSKFVKEHSHPLNASGFPTYNRMMESKDRKIQQLTQELEHRDRLCQRYRRLLLSLMETVEEETECLSRKVELVVNNVKQLENEVQKPLNTV